MAEQEASYHRRRATEERALALQSDDPATRQAHEGLATRHRQKADKLDAPQAVQKRLGLKLG